MNDLQVTPDLTTIKQHTQNQTVVSNQKTAGSDMTTRSLIHNHDFCAIARRLWYKIYQETSSANITLSKYYTKHGDFQLI